MTKDKPQEDTVPEKNRDGKEDVIRLPDLEEQLLEAQEKQSRFREVALLAQADLENYRKRVDEEQARHNQATAGRLLLKLLPILDNLGRALDSITIDSSNKAWIEGIRLIEQGIQSILTSERVSKIEVSKGQPFDPWEQEAVFSVETDEYQSNTIVEVVRKGYRHHDRILRVAQVSVAQSKDVNYSPKQDKADKAGKS
jgi:molecular chaperone GrpE